MHLPHLNHHQFSNTNRPPSMSLPPLGSQQQQQQQQDNEDVQQQLRYPDLTAAEQGLSDVLGGQMQQHQHHLSAALIDGDGDDRLMPTLLSSLAASTSNPSSATTDTFISLFNNQSINGDQVCLLLDVLCET